VNDPTPDKPRQRRKTSERGLPHSWETERTVLGGLLIAPERLVDIRGILAPDDFHRPSHVALYGLLIEMANHGAVPATLAVVDEIERRDWVEKVGGLAYVIALPQACPTIDLVESYARRVRDYAVRRELVNHVRLVEADVLDGVKPTAELLDAAGAGVIRLAATVGAPELPPIATIVDQQLDELRRRAQNPGAITGIPTGFEDLDRKLAGLQRTDLVVLAARPAMGKTALLGNIAVNAARRGYVVGLFELEMSRGQLVQRMLCAEARVDASAARVGRLEMFDWQQLTRAGDDVARLPIHIDDTPGLSLIQLRTRLRALDARARAESGRGIDLLILDYLQLMSGTGAKGESRENVISAISRGLKIVAKEMNIAVVALSQLNRGLEARADKRPLPSDLRESGAIEQDADVILFIYRDEVYNKDASPKKGIAEIIIAKQRSGPIGTVELAFIDKYVKFESLAGPMLDGGGF
jgi:replicative DNA helicase